MSSNHVPWLTILGWGEDGIEGLTKTSLAVLHQAQHVFGARRHLSRLPTLSAQVHEWPVPFQEGIPQLLAKRGAPVVMLASGDPFWFGAGSVLSQRLAAHEWQAFPGRSSFSLAAAALGWHLEAVTCLGLHARNHSRLRPYLQPGHRLLVLVRDGAAVKSLGEQLNTWGCAGSQLTILEALGGTDQRVTTLAVGNALPDQINHPVMVAVQVKISVAHALPLNSGIADDFFEHDGQITKQAVRAQTLAALAPRQGELLWDIGAGSGSIAIEWLLAHPDNQAIAFERALERVERIQRNAVALGVDWLKIVAGDAMAQLAEQPLPQAVFIGGGLSDALLEKLWELLPAGVRLVANAVTLESEQLMHRWRERVGGDLLKLELSVTKPLGSMQAWQAAYPIVQWQVIR